MNKNIFTFMEVQSQKVTNGREEGRPTELECEFIYLPCLVFCLAYPFQKRKPGDQALFPCNEGNEGYREREREVTP